MPDVDQLLDGEPTHAFHWMSMLKVR